MLHDLLNSALQDPAKSLPTASPTGNPTCALVEENPKKFIFVHSICDGEEPKTERKHIWPVVYIYIFFIHNVQQHFASSISIFWDQSFFKLLGGAMWKATSNLNLEMNQLLQVSSLGHSIIQWKREILQQK